MAVINYGDGFPETASSGSSPSPGGYRDWYEEPLDDFDSFISARPSGKLGLSKCRDRESRRRHVHSMRVVAKTSDHSRRPGESDEEASSYD